jgi:hypothetical protein
MLQLPTSKYQSIFLKVSARARLETFLDGRRVEARVVRTPRPSATITPKRYRLELLLYQPVPHDYYLVSHFANAAVMRDYDAFL